MQNRLVEWKTDRGKQRGFLLQFILAESVYENINMVPHAVVEIGGGRIVYIEICSARDICFVEPSTLE